MVASSTAREGEAIIGESYELTSNICGKIGCCDSADISAGMY